MVVETETNADMWKEKSLRQCMKLHTSPSAIKVMRTNAKLRMRLVSFTFLLGTLCAMPRFYTDDLRTQPSHFNNFGISSSLEAN